MTILMKRYHLVHSAVSGMDSFHSSNHTHFFGGAAGDKHPGTGVQDAETMLVLLGGSCSLVGLAFAFITYSLFSDAVELGGPTLLNLLACVFLSQLSHLLTFAAEDYLHGENLCKPLILLQLYFHVTQLIWLLFTAYELWKSVRRGFASDGGNNEHTFLRLSLIGWGAPLILTVLAAGLEFHTSPGLPKNLNHHCSISQHSWSQMIFVASGLLLVTLTLKYLWKAWRLAKFMFNITQYKTVLVRAKLIIKLVLILNVSWVFNVIALFVQHEALWTAGQVCFSLQGLFIALCLTCDCQLIRSFSRHTNLHIKKYGASEVIHSSQLDLTTWENPPQPRLI